MHIILEILTKFKGKVKELVLKEISTHENKILIKEESFLEKSGLRNLYIFRIL